MRFEGRSAEHDDRRSPSLRRIDAEPERRPERSLEALPTHHGPAPLREPAARAQAMAEASPGRLAAPRERASLRRVEAAPEPEPERTLAPLQVESKPGLLAESRAHPEAAPERFQGGQQRARAPTPLAQVDVAPQAAPERFEAPLAVRSQPTLLRQPAVEPQSALARFRERLAARRALSGLRQVETASEPGPQRTLAPLRSQTRPALRVDPTTQPEAAPARFEGSLAVRSQPTPLRPPAVEATPEREPQRTLAPLRARSGLAPLRQPVVTAVAKEAPTVATERVPPAHLDQTEQNAITQRFAAIREKELNKRLRAAERRRRRRLSAVRKLPALRRPAVEASSALVRFRARLVTRRALAVLRQPVPRPEAAPRRLPAQDLAAEVETQLERLEAACRAELERQYAARYGPGVVRLACEYTRIEAEHGPSCTLWLTLDPGSDTPNRMQIHDGETVHYTGTHTPQTVARALFLHEGRPLDPPEILKMELTLTQQLALHRVRQQTPKR